MNGGGGGRVVGLPRGKDVGEKKEKRKEGANYLKKRVWALEAH